MLLVFAHLLGMATLVAAFLLQRRTAPGPAGEPLDVRRGGASGHWARTDGNRVADRHGLRLCQAGPQARRRAGGGWASPCPFAARRVCCPCSCPRWPDWSSSGPGPGSRDLPSRLTHSPWASSVHQPLHPALQQCGVPVSRHVHMPVAATAGAVSANISSSSYTCSARCARFEEIANPDFGTSSAACCWRPGRQNRGCSAAVVGKPPPTGNRSRAAHSTC